MTDRHATLDQARAHHSQGRLAEAAAGYREVLAREPGNADALHLLGIATAALGRPQDAAQLIASAVRLRPADAVMHANLARALSDSGRHEEAVACYDRAVALRPDFPLAFRGRGAALLQLGRFAAAHDSILKALELAPEDAQAHNDLGVVLERAGRKEDALAAFERAIALDPRHAEAHHNRGLLQSALGRHAQALESLDRALALQPRQPATHANRGQVLHALGRDAEAIASFDAALALRPGVAATHHDRGIALLSLARPAEALASFDRALALAPGAAATHQCRGKACIELGRAGEALASFDRAVALAPRDFASHYHRGVALALLDRDAEALASFDQAIAINDRSAEARGNRGVALARLGRSEEALAEFARAVELDPGLASAHTNAANAQQSVEQYAAARASYDRALALRPDDPTIVLHKAFLLLLLGEFREGWRLHEARLRRVGARRPPPLAGAPRWTGAEPLDGRTLYVPAEQGLGDTLQFCRYLPLLAARGARLVLEVQPALRRLLAPFAAFGAVVGYGEPLPPYDCYCPLMSLPLAFATELDSIPGGVPYLEPDVEALRVWRGRLAALPGLKVGLNWQGNPETEKQAWLRGRSFPLAAAAPLFDLQGVSWVSLQSGYGAEQRDQVAFREALVELIDPREQGADEVVRTAALVASLDLVVTSDTFIAHLAGALGVPVWVVLKSVPDWRWLTQRDDSPWYPSMRLFRQRRAGDWAELFARLAGELAALRSRAADSHGP